jgi:ribokinase
MSDAAARRPVVTVTGYAAVDRAMTVLALPGADQTAIVSARLRGGRARQGGCAPYVARLLAADGHAVELVSWFGDDPEGRRYLRDLAAEGVGLAGAAVTAGARTPEAWLFYDPEGRSMCFYDPGAPPAGGWFAPAQRELVATADWVCVTVGPRQLNAAVLPELAPGARLVFAAKADPDGFPAQVVRDLAARADVLVYARGERAFLAAAVGGDPRAATRPGCLVVETRGAGPVALWRDGHHATVAVEPVPAADTTGAGDAFVAGLLGRLVREAEDTDEAAVAAGVAAARRHLAREAVG